jgi:acetylornithine deacetylase/succinyl-diaminopimelate desuccinylase-like protein
LNPVVSTGLVERVIERALEIQQIPAPTFAEAERADFVKRCFEAEGLKDVTVDALSNVTGRLPGASGKPFVVLSAHTDTVFPKETDLTATRKGDSIRAPGIGDNSLGVAGLFGAMWLLKEAGLTLPGDLWLAANVGEEGLGNLTGMKAIVDRFGGEPAAYIVLEGLAYGRVFYQGLGVRRLSIEVTGPGGHSWVDHGRPSAIVGLANLINELDRLRIPRRPRTTLNVGVIQGGTSVNTIPAKASLQLDLRSTDVEALDRLTAEVERLVQAANSVNLRFESRIIGERPVGKLAKSHPLVIAAAQALASRGKKADLNIGSTDANMPLSRGYPAVCIGLAIGGDVHTTSEFMRTGLLPDGLAQLRDLLLAAYKLAE